MNEYNENGKMNGYWKEYDKYGKLFSEGIYENGFKTGYWKRYHLNGKILCEGKYINNLKNDLWKEYRLNGSLLSRGNYNNDVKTGCWQYYKHNGKIFAECNYSKNKNGDALGEYNIQDLHPTEGGNKKGKKHWLLKIIENIRYIWGTIFKNKLRM